MCPFSRFTTKTYNTIKSKHCVILQYNYVNMYLFLGGKLGSQGTKLISRKIRGGASTLD